MAPSPMPPGQGLPGRGVAAGAVAVAVALAGAGMAFTAVRDAVESGGRPPAGARGPGAPQRARAPVALEVEPAVSRSPRTVRPVGRTIRSQALGRPWAGRLENGVALRPEGAAFFTWDPIWHLAPNRRSRLYGTDVLTLYVQRVLAGYKAAHPDAPRVGIGDLSRPRGGPFGARFGAPGHNSHQNGLDVDLYYPRRDRTERPPSSPDQIDHALAQDLVDRFARTGAQFVFVGPATGLDRPGAIVQELDLHDDHLHVRIPAPAP